MSDWRQYSSLRTSGGALEKIICGKIHRSIHTATTLTHLAAVWQNTKIGTSNGNLEGGIKND